MATTTTNGFTSVLKKAFPFLSAAASLGGPLGTMAAAAVGSALGMGKSPAPTGDAISNAIALAFSDPTQRAALLKAEQDFQLQMTQLGYQNSQEIEAIAEKDRDSARNREIQVKDRTPKILAAVIIVATVIVESYVTVAVFHHQTFDSQGAVILGRILGMLDTSVGLVLAYYFGSSAGSAAKTDILAAQQNGKP